MALWSRYLFSVDVGWKSLSFQPVIKPSSQQLQHVTVSLKKTKHFFFSWDKPCLSLQWNTRTDALFSFSVVANCVSLKMSEPSAVLSLCLCVKLPWAACWSLPSHLLAPRWPVAVHPATSAVGSVARPRAWKMASSLDGEAWMHLCRHSVKPSKYLTLA